jgi:hypothetical protein
LSTWIGCKRADRSATKQALLVVDLVDELRRRVAAGQKP